SKAAPSVVTWLMQGRSEDARAWGARSAVPAAALAARNSRRLMARPSPALSKIASLAGIRDVAGRAHGPGPDREGGILLRQRDEGAAVHDEQVRDVVRPAERVEHRGPRIGSHPAGSRLVAGEAAETVLAEEELDRHLVVDGRQPIHHVREERAVVVAELEPNHGRR